MEASLAALTRPAPVIAFEKMHTQIWTLAAYICGLSAQVMPISHLNCIAAGWDNCTTRATKNITTSQPTHTTHKPLGRNVMNPAASHYVMCIRRGCRVEKHITSSCAQLFSLTLQTMRNIASALNAQNIVCSSHSFGVAFEFAIISTTHFKNLWNAHKYCKAFLLLNRI